MTTDRDHYEAYYADKLWQLLPAVYRFEDGEDPRENGPLRELVHRIGAQAAIVRRGIDRLWEDQSIESCEDWVIPYIADLLDARLVAGLAPRQQRVNVGKTIYYRRRKGTVAMLEELAADITGWQVRVVEFFRRLARTRHSLDPPLREPAGGNETQQAALLREEGLRGRLTGTCCGGWADLRKAYGAAKTGTAFDEFFHSADVRPGRGRLGWHNIPRLGVFLWRLYSISSGLGFDSGGSALAGSTPVRKAGETGDCARFSFDPTGREIPLFAASTRGFGDAWVAAQEWQLPTPISSGLLGNDFARLYAQASPTDATVRYQSLALLQQGKLIQAAEVTADWRDFAAAAGKFLIEPEQGTFICSGTVPDGLSVIYHYGAASVIGAGEYDRTPFSGSARVTAAGPEASGGGDDLATKLSALAGGGAASGDVTIADSRTYHAVSDLPAIEKVVLQSRNKCRPLIRLPEENPVWILGGEDEDATLVLDGIFLSGGDVVLRGTFKSVTLSSCTFDPGTANGDGSAYAVSIDERKLAPTTLWIEGHVEQLVVSRSVLGPIRERNGGWADLLQISDSIVQAIQLSGDEAAVTLSLGLLKLERCSVMGRARVHRLKASDSILDDVFEVEDCQDGCLRFSAWATGSVLPRRYECVEIDVQAPVFVSGSFGDPAYGQVAETADRLIRSGDNAGGISQGAYGGCEMGALYAEQYPVRLRALRQKYDEFMPVGLAPVFIAVT